MVVKIAAHLVILGLHVLEVLLARIEIVLPSSAIVTAIAKQNKFESQYMSVCHLLGNC